MEFNDSVSSMRTSPDPLDIPAGPGDDTSDLSGRLSAGRVSEGCHGSNPAEVSFGDPFCGATPFHDGVVTTSSSMDRVHPGLIGRALGLTNVEDAVANSVAVGVSSPFDAGNTYPSVPPAEMADFDVSRRLPTLPALEDNTHNIGPAHLGSGIQSSPRTETPRLALDNHKRTPHPGAPLDITII